MSEHSPAPVPARGVYGFGLYLICSLSFVMFLIWAIVPDHHLQSLGLTYYPQKYWAIAVPIYVMMGLFLFAFFFYPALNQSLAPPLDSCHTIHDSHSLKEPELSCHEDQIPPAFDLDISYVCSTLYRNKNHNN